MNLFRVIKNKITGLTRETLTVGQGSKIPALHPNVINPDAINIELTDDEEEEDKEDGMYVRMHIAYL